MSKIRILVTGHEGFIGKNLLVRLKELKRFDVQTFGRDDDPNQLTDKCRYVDVVIHLAGENRPDNPKAFAEVNLGLTQALCQALKSANAKSKVLFASSTQAEMDNLYGRSKAEAEESLQHYVTESGGTVVVYRLPNVFGKWCKPNYNSVVATFCHNISQALPITVNDEATKLKLVYIDDVVDDFLLAIESRDNGWVRKEVKPVYSITLGDLIRKIQSFKNDRHTLQVDEVGKGLTRALYSTYMSYLRPEQFDYGIPIHSDDRGVFVEMLKTGCSGQISFFSARPGVIRGSHYHHTKTEKFLVVQGLARFGFRHLLTNEKAEIEVSGKHPRIVETIPGWVHDIRNIGDDELLVIIWANEVFDRQAPDTIPDTV